MRRRPRQLSAEEERLWNHAVRDTTPLHPQNRRPAATGTAALPALPSAQASADRAGPAPPVVYPSLPRTPRQSQQLDLSRPVDMDRRNWQRLKRGQMGIDARLDLHGLSQVEAHDRLSGFIIAQQARGSRCLLVITGMGERNGGILRNMTPRWLDTEPNRSRILAYSTAHVRDGGPGALYVLLKRRR